MSSCICFRRFAAVLIAGAAVCAVMPFESPGRGAPANAASSIVLADITGGLGELRAASGCKALQASDSRSTLPNAPDGTSFSHAPRAKLTRAPGHSPQRSVRRLAGSAGIARGATGPLHAAVAFGGKGGAARFDAPTASDRCIWLGRFLL